LRLRARGRRVRRSSDQRASGPRFWVALLLAVAAALAWAYVPVAALVAHTPPQRPAAQPGLPWLSVSADHRRIVDDLDRTVLLRGFNSDALLEDTVRHAALDDTDADLMAQSGFDVVRLPIAWSLLEPQRGRIDDAYLDRVVSEVAVLNRHHLYVLLDMHFLDWSPRFGGSGAPAWAALPVVPNLPWWPDDTWKRHLSPAQLAAYTYFWLSPDWQADFNLVWRTVAAQFRDDSGVVGYDIFNEPHPLPIPPRIFELHWMWPLYARTIDQIGRVDSNHLFIVEGILFADFGTAVLPLHGDSVVYSPHIYTGSLVPPAFTGDRHAIDQHITDQVRESADVPAPMLPGELGIDRGQAHSAQWADAVLDEYDDVDAGWIWWQWRESSGWGIRDEAGTRLDMSFLRHLARPYLAAASPRVHEGRGNGVDGSITVRVDPGADDAVVALSWPELTLGAPAPVTASCVVVQSWDPHTSRLWLTLSAAGCSLSVRAA